MLIAMARGIRITFYADRDDLKTLFEHFVGIGDFTYTLSYWDEGQPAPTVVSPLSIPDYGVMKPPCQSICTVSYLVLDASCALSPRRYCLSAGGARYTVDNGTNPSSVRLSPGGDAGDHTLIASQIDTLGLTERARSMQAAFARIVRKCAVRVGNCYVLPGAMAKYKLGWRLTYGKGYSRSLDLSIPE